MFGVWKKSHRFSLKSGYHGLREMKSINIVLLIAVLLALATFNYIAAYVPVSSNLLLLMLVLAMSLPSVYVLRKKK